ncbi:MAG: DotH/IcmK family type IV secretion protein [Pseudomonadota bacterium]|nr:DotH/IcmK family type IV secretion protein [Pseudomonadota bacterium]
MIRIRLFALIPLLAPILVGAETHPTPDTPFNVVVGNNPPAPPTEIMYRGQRPLPVKEEAPVREYQPDFSNISPMAKEAVRMLNPLTPEDIRYKEYVDQQVLKARAAKFRVPNMRNRVMVYGSGQVQDNRVLVFPGYTTSLVFVDSQGNPWPVKQYRPGNEAVYVVNGNESEEYAHILTVSLKKQFIPSNLNVILKGNPIPLVIDLDSNDSSLDRLVTVSVGGVSPSLKKDASFNPVDLPSINDNIVELAPFLNNTPPDGAIIVSVFGDDDTSVWYWGNRFICRTKSKLTYPVPINPHHQMRSVDDRWTVYDLGPHVPPVFSLLNGYGEFQKITVAVDEVL